MTPWILISKLKFKLQDLWPSQNSDGTEVSRQQLLWPDEFQACSLQRQSSHWVVENGSGERRGAPEGFSLPCSSSIKPGEDVEGRKRSLPWSVHCWGWQVGTKHTPDICGSSRAGWDHKTKMRKEGSSLAMRAHAFNTKKDIQTSEQSAGCWERTTTPQFVPERRGLAEGFWEIRFTIPSFCLWRICKIFKQKSSFNPLSQRHYSRVITKPWY